jgi:flagellar motor component MotA
LAADGTGAELVENLLRTRAQTMVRNHRLRLRMMQQGIAALQAGTNPRLLFREMQAHYLDPDVWEPAKRSKEDLTGAALRDWIERGWLTIRKPADITEMFLHLGSVARNEGKQALAMVASEIELPLLLDGLKEVAGGGSTPVALQQKMTATIEADVAVLAGRLSANLAGILGVMAGRHAEQVAAAMHEAAAAPNDS